MTTNTKTWSNLLEKLLSGDNLNRIESEELMKAWLSEELQPVQTGAFLAAFRAKGPTGVELASMARVLREACKIPLPIPPIPLVDTCGTGGDGANTFNISTAVAFLSSTCGVNIAKHGNRSASGKVGSADVLEDLGLQLKAPLEKVVDALTNEKITFLFAPAWHSSLVNLAPLRKSLGIRTIFNLLGPLVNPLRPSAQVLGVANSTLLIPMSEALLEMGIERAVIIHGAGGLDEASLEGPNQICFLEKGELTKSTLDPSDFGIPYSSNKGLHGGDLSDNSRILSSILKGEGLQVHNQVVALNNSLVLWASGLETNLKVGFDMSLKCLSSGDSWKTFERLSTFLAN